MCGANVIFYTEGAWKTLFRVMVKADTIVTFKRRLDRHLDV